MMTVRFLVFVVVALLSYVATVAAAFVYWDLTGASGPDYTPLLFVLFILAPAVALMLATLVVRRMRRPHARQPDAGRAVPDRSGGPVVTARRNGPAQWTIAFCVMVLIGVMLALLGPGRLPFLPRLTP
jgi:hypothetical protein